MVVTNGYNESLCHVSVTDFWKGLGMYSYKYLSCLEVSALSPPTTHQQIHVHNFHLEKMCFNQMRCFVDEERRIVRRINYNYEFNSAPLEIYKFQGRRRAVPLSIRQVYFFT